MTTTRLSTSCGACHHVSKDVFQETVVNFLDIIGDGFFQFIYCVGIAAINFVFYSAPYVKVWRHKIRRSWWPEIFGDNAAPKNCL